MRPRLWRRPTAPAPIALGILEILDLHCAEDSRAHNDRPEHTPGSKAQEQRAVARGFGPDGNLDRPSLLGTHLEEKMAHATTAGMRYSLAHRIWSAVISPRGTGSPRLVEGVLFCRYGRALICKVENYECAANTENVIRSHERRCIGLGQEPEKTDKATGVARDVIEGAGGFSMAFLAPGG
ncbi:hypothetical protein DL770_003717 [Monosporascus sp. CRB-9-2]|nr:hypothetical protein DL770_003717 [Monosporascus sp. CRB-9-2]